jgi:hypothetical protein
MTTEFSTEYRLNDCILMLLESTLSLASRAETRTCTVEFAAVEAEAVVRHSIVPVVLEVTVQVARTAVALDMMSTIILVLLELKPLPVSTRCTPPAALPEGVPVLVLSEIATPSSERTPFTLRLLAFVA